MNGKAVVSLILPLLVTCIAVSPALLVPSPPLISHQSAVNQQLTSGSSSNIDPTFGPGGTRIAYSSKTLDGNFQIWIMDSNGSHKVRLTSLPGNAILPQWSPNLGRSSRTPLSVSFTAALVLRAL